MTRRALFVLGAGQCVNWGVLYYAFAILLLPVESDLDAPRWIVAGAFSLALLMSAVFAPIVGRLTDRGHGPTVMRWGAIVACLLLVLWALLPSVLTLYVTWTGLGVCMAATLYEPAFAIVGRAHQATSDRLRALATVTVFGGLASTLIMPLTALLVKAAGWRTAVGVLALLVLAAHALTEIAVFRTLRDDGHGSTIPARRSGEEKTTLPFALLLGMFALAALATSAFTSNIVPALGARSVAPTTAALLGGLLGIMQLPGRLLMMRGALDQSPPRLVLVSLVLQGLGLAALALTRTTWVVGAGIAVFAMGAGLTTVARPYVVQSAFHIDQFGFRNGQLVRAQQLARAAGPIVATWTAGSVGYSVVLIGMAIVFGGLALASPGIFARLGTFQLAEEI